MGVKLILRTPWAGKCQVQLIKAEREVKQDSPSRFVRLLQSEISLLMVFLVLYIHGLHNESLLFIKIIS